MEKLRHTAVALLLSCSFVAAGSSQSSALSQTFGANERGLWVIGSYWREAGIASKPDSTVYAGGGVLIAMRTGLAVNVARIAAEFWGTECTRALGHGNGTTWADQWCYAI